MVANLAVKLREGGFENRVSPEYCLERVAGGNLIHYLKSAIEMAEKGDIPLEELRVVATQGLERKLKDEENLPSCKKHYRDEQLQQLEDLGKGWAVGFKGVGTIPPTLVDNNKYGGLIIKGDDEFRKGIIEGLGHIGVYSPFYLSYVQENIHTIVEGKRGMAHIASAKCKIPGNMFPPITAETLIHEAAHLEDFTRRNWLGKFAFVFGFLGGFLVADIEVYALDHELAFVKSSTFGDRERAISMNERMRQDLKKLPWYCFVFPRDYWQFIYTGY